MRTAAAILMLLALGCGEAAPKLRFIDVGLDESDNPMPFALKVANDGGADAIVDDIDVLVDSHAIVGDFDAGDVPASFDASVTLKNPAIQDGVVSNLSTGQRIALTAGKASNVWAAPVWRLPENPPPLIVVIAARFALKHGDRAVITTPRHTFVMQSRPGVIDSVLRDEPRIAEQDAEMLELLKSQKGKASPSVKDLIERLESLTRKS